MMGFMPCFYIISIACYSLFQQKMKRKTFSFGQINVIVVCLTYRTANDRSPVTFAIAAEETEYVHISECPVFVVSGSYNGISAKDMWHEVKQVRDLLSNVFF